MILDIIKTFGPMLMWISGGTLFISVFMLAVYFIRKKKNPNNPKNRILGWIGVSFLAFTLFGGLILSGLVRMDQEDANGKEDVATFIEGNNMGYTHIDMEMAKAIFEVQSDYMILDVRRADEFNEGHIPGAINVPNEDIADAKLVELPDKKQTIYVYCRSGNRSKQAARKLAAIGYENIIEFGGIIDWTGEIEK